MKGREIINALAEVFQACSNISEAGICDKCPIRYNCIDDTTFSEICSFVSIGEFDEMIGLGKDADDYANEQDMADYIADQQRKMEVEERMIDEAYG